VLFWMAGAKWSDCSPATLWSEQSGIAIATIIRTGLHRGFGESRKNVPWLCPPCPKWQKIRKRTINEMGMCLDPQKDNQSITDAPENQMPFSVPALTNPARRPRTHSRIGGELFPYGLTIWDHHDRSRYIWHSFQPTFIPMALNHLLPSL
jgi:hypothetical protein